MAWTRHAEGARLTDRYGEIPKVPIVDLAQCKPIEVEVEGRRVRKVVVRTNLDAMYDLVLVLIPGPNAWTVKTVWLNSVKDLHKTLDRSRYVC